MSMTLTVYGAVNEVTGSCYLLQCGNSRVLLECGIHQGLPDAEARNKAPFPFDVQQLDTVVLSHSHLDHSGLLPKLVASGYHGPIYCTPPTKGLLKIMLMDAAYIQQRDVEWENMRRKRAGRELIKPLYTLDDVRRTLAQCRTLDYAEPKTVAPGVELDYRDAGHILGSAHIQLRLNDKGHQRTLLFSGDIGNPDSILMHDPDPPEQADVVLMEGTYGNRDHQPMEATLEEFAAILQQAHDEGGNVLIPAFAVGRTQEIIYHLMLLRNQGRLPQQQIFLDSPMAIEVSELYLDNLEELDQVDIDALTDNDRFSLDELLRFIYPTRTPEESQVLNRIQSGAIIIAGSGMCNGGRIRHHFKHRLWRQDTHVVFVGFQAGGTLGRRLVDGAERVSIMGNDIAVRAQIHTLGGYSAHAGRRELLNWAKTIGGEPEFHLVHGEQEALAAFRESLESELGIRASIPDYGDVITI